MSRYNDERGFTTTFFAIMLPVCLAFLGLCADGAIIIYHRLALESAADAATISTIDAYDREIWISQGQVVLREELAEDYAEEVLLQHIPEARMISFEVPDNQKNMCMMNVELEVPTFFLKLFGQESFIVRADSKAHGY